MDILGVGFPELIFILIIAMMIFGPRRLPEIAAKAGKIVRDIRGMSQGLLLEWQREITVAARLEELEEVKKELQQTRQELNQTQKEIKQQTREDIEQVKKTIPTTMAQSQPARTNPASPQTQDSSESDAAPPESAAADAIVQNNPADGAGAEPPVEKRNIAPPSKAPAAANPNLESAQPNGHLPPAANTPTEPADGEMPSVSSESQEARNE